MSYSVQYVLGTVQGRMMLVEGFHSTSGAQPELAQHLREPCFTTVDTVPSCVDLLLSFCDASTMNQIPEILYGSKERTTWVIIGASRGIGLEFVRQLLIREERIFATVRETNAAHASALWSQVGGGNLDLILGILGLRDEKLMHVRSWPVSDANM
jgi:hypothetical protein